MTILQHNKKPVPRPSPSATPATSTNPSANYSDVLNMALKFNNWTLAFTELQKAFGLPLVQIPNTIINDLKPEFAGNSSINNISPPAEELSFVRPVSPEPDISLEQIDIYKDPMITENQTPFTLVNNKKKNNKPKVSKNEITPQEAPSTSSTNQYKLAIPVTRGIIRGMIVKRSNAAFS